MSDKIRELPGYKVHREIDFFLRLHRHLPDNICGGTTADGRYDPTCNCMYREDGEPINVANDYVDKLQKDPKFREKEKEVKQAVEKGLVLYHGKKRTFQEGFQLVIKRCKASGMSDEEIQSFFSK